MGICFPHKYMSIFGIRNNKQRNNKTYERNGINRNQLHGSF